MLKLLSEQVYGMASVRKAGRNAAAVAGDDISPAWAA
jgi:hypothetical protein